MCAKANKHKGYVKRTLGNSCSFIVKLHCYKMLVRPLLEYGSIIWSFGNKKLLFMVESVQCRASSYIIQTYNISYKERLVQCCILPLSLRREILDLNFSLPCSCIYRDHTCLMQSRFSLCWALIYFCQCSCPTTHLSLLTY